MKTHYILFHEHRMVASLEAEARCSHWAVSGVQGTPAERGRAGDVTLFFSVGPSQQST